MTDSITAMNSSSTEDDLCSEVFPRPVLLFGAICVFVMGTVGTLANGLTMAALIRCTSARRPSTAFIINLFFAELLLCVIILPLIGAAMSQILYYGEVQTAVRTVVIIGIFARMLDQVVLQTIAVIALYRLIAIWFPHSYKRLKTVRAVSASLAAVWASSILLKVPVIIEYVSGNVHYCKTLLRFKVKSSAWLGIYTSICYVLPVLFILASYFGILLKMGTGSRLFRDEYPGGMTTGTNAQRRQPWKDSVTKSVLVVSTILFICSTPHCIMHALEPYMGTWNGSAWILLHLLYFIQFTADPVVYVVMSVQYQRALQEVFYVCLGRAHQRPYPSMGSSHTPSQWDTQTVIGTRVNKSMESSQ